MKRLVLELPYQNFWERFFGPGSKKVRVVEGLKCFKCDNEGFALLCKLKFLDKKMNAEDLVGRGSVTKAEALYIEKDGASVVFISGEYSKALPWARRISHGKDLPRQASGVQ